MGVGEIEQKGRVWHFLSYEKGNVISTPSKGCQTYAIFYVQENQRQGYHSVGNFNPQSWGMLISTTTGSAWLTMVDATKENGGIKIIKPIIMWIVASGNLT